MKTGDEPLEESTQVSAFYALVVVSRYRQRRRQGQPELEAIALAASDAWDFIEGLASDPELEDDRNALQDLVSYLSLEETL